MLNFDLGLDFVGVIPGQLLLAGGRDQDVTGGRQDAAFVWRGVGEAHDGAVLLVRRTREREKENETYSRQVTGPKYILGHAPQMFCQVGCTAVEDVGCRKTVRPLGGTLRPCFPHWH